MLPRKWVISIQKFITKYRGVYYGQEGEDLIIYNLLKSKAHAGVHHIKYLDIGCGDPRWINNTYLLYRMGASGWCIDANNAYKSQYKRWRKRDFFLPICVGPYSGHNVDFYLTHNKDRSTADTKGIVYLKEQNIKIDKIINVPTLSINCILDIIKCSDIDFLNIDIEGLDFSVLLSIDYNVFRPRVICVEAINLLTGYNSQDVKYVIDRMNDNGYMLVINTIVNLIFIDNSYAKERSCII